jgi:Rap1a immunity proteins
MTKFAVAILLLALTMPASAQKSSVQRSANEMLSGCKGFLDENMTGVSMFYKGRCVGFLAGLAYGVGFCQPQGVTTGQVVAVVVKYIEARPERMHEDFGELAIEAMQAAWPCKR